ncbi:MAG: CoxG family protein [Paracoccaceae bacterium]
MELVGTRIIAADRATVWAALNEADVLRQSIPGCTSLTGNPKDGFAAVIVQKIGPVKATFKGTVTLSDVVEGRSYRLTGEGKAGPAGYARGGANVSLGDADGGTELVYEVKAMVGGKLASLGARLIDGVAKKLADQFFENLQNAVENVADTEQDAAQQPPPGIVKRMLNWFRRLLGL